MKLPYRQTTQVQSSPSALNQVLAWFNQFNQPPIPDSIWMECQLALAEGFMNAVRHAHGNLPADTPIDVEVYITDRLIHLKIWDRGSGFNLDKQLNDSTGMEQAAEHGRGLKIIQKISDHLSYEQMDQRNCFSIVKRYS